MSDDLTFDPSKKKKKSKKTAVAEDDAAVDAVTEQLSELDTLKKKKKKSSTENGDDAAAGGDETVDSGEFEFKKKKKKSKKAAVVDDFDKELEQAGVDQKGAAQQTASKYSNVNEDGEPDLTYPQLLERFFEVLNQNNPELAAGSGAKYKIPPPQVMREGNKKSLFANIKEISERMNRPTEHVIQFLFAELGTSGSVDGSNRLIIKGRFTQKQLETVLRRYIMEYVTCKTCKSANTSMNKENRLFFLQCNSCGSRRSVSSIKTGYQAIMRRRDMKKKV